MSSDEEDPNFYDLSSRPRRPQQVPQARSCDNCRRRKTRCGGPTVPGGCSNCLAFGSPCTYLQPTRKRGPKNKLVEELKRRVVDLEAKLRTLSICSLCAQPFKKSLPNEDKAPTGASVFTPQGSTTAALTLSNQPPPEDDFAPLDLGDRFGMLALSGVKTRFYGAASSYTLMNTAVASKEKFLGRPAAQHSRRPLFWQILPWEKEEYDQRPQYVYPESDLIASLLDLYFTIIHPILPILHRPSFQRSVAEGLHLKDTKFGEVLLVVLGVASRHSDDHRVFIDNSTLSAGWKFVNQVQVFRKNFDPTLYEVQFYCLMTWFSAGTSAPQIGWVYLGLGIRCLQHRGEHRRKQKWEPSHELWKRAFWSLCMFDRLMTGFTGRPAGIRTEDCDVELPIEVDDEYWEHGFTQPAGKPSLLSYFVCHVRLCEILGDALRRLYSSNKSKVLMGWSGPEWEQRAVAELDSAMNDWLNTVPAHLRWDPERKPDAFFDQSAVLYATYYHTQIAIHRQYTHKATRFSPSLSICTSAARSAVHVADVWLKKSQRLPAPFLMNPVFVSGVLLFLNIFGSKRAGVLIDKNPDLARVQTAMSFLKFTEARWQSAGRLWELLQELHSLDLNWPPQIELLPAESGASKGVAEPITTSRETPAAPHGAHTSYTESFAPTPYHPWNSMDSSSNPSLPLNDDASANLSIEQLLADTAEYDVPPPPPNSSWGDSSNNAIDDEFMSLLLAAPIDFSAWNAYISTEI
ncbi:fungal-specific transcription factor domain-containing protein [Mycena rosella]|uniref:Fungal-specific transcription factor domain-containing protein n=1 Tax=Mycena rosella TaxID=1033263 RepID=A0AAD7DP48_MYCRO|nr:fungal-specific transcription factor domain-containing protein [Mycena rosella]